MVFQQIPHMAAERIRRSIKSIAKLFQGVLLDVLLYDLFEERISAVEISVFCRLAQLLKVRGCTLRNCLPRIRICSGGLEPLAAKAVRGKHSYKTLIRVLYKYKSIVRLL